MHHRRNRRARAKRLAHGAHVGDVALDELAVLDRVAMAGDQVVEDDDAVAGALQRLGGVAADVAGAAGDEHRARVSGQWRNT